MSQPKLFAARMLLLASTLTVGTVHAESDNETLFSGTTRLACEALLCLSSSAGGSIGACSPALSHYFGIKKRKFSDTLSARLSFLQQCPVANQTPAMASLVQAISQGAGRCDADSLNQVLQTLKTDRRGREYLVIGNTPPGYCSAYTGHAYTDLSATTPKYVGKPEDGGYWVAPSQYESELIKYQAALEEKRKREQEQHYSDW
ncbi:MAG: TrbM/KikA/MpfK family conjugal transfer protein [Porticoccaceae bacterium]